MLRLAESKDERLNSPSSCLFSENYSAYEFYTEVLNTLIVFFSTQLHRSHVNEGNYFLDLLLDKFG